MDFSLTDDQREIQALARDFAQAEIEPNAAAWDREHRFPDELYPKLGELGLMGVCVPEELGGAGADFLSYILVLEEISRADAGVGVTVAVHTSACTLPILAFGTDEQRERFVPPLARGEKIGAFALTEAGAGSDAGAIRTLATPDGDGWRISGTKQFISTARQAGTFLFFARTDPAIEGARGISAFLLDRDHVEVTREEEKLGLNSSSTGELRIEARVDGDRLLHEEGKGFTVAMATLDGGRIGIAAQALGIAQGATDYALDYAKDRETMGKPIAQHQLVAAKLADMETATEAARGLLYRFGRMADDGVDGPELTKASAQAKLFCSDTAMWVATEAVQILGGYGYVKEYPVERMMRDAKITQIYEGTNEIQRLVIAREMLRENRAFLLAGVS
jgi:alkylation response protein AidB-like acyl-CoA dehydrogenase